MGKVRVEKKSRSHGSVGAGAASQAAVHRASAGGGGGGASRGGASIRQDISFNKDFGQHILKNPLVVKGIVEKVRGWQVARTPLAALVPDLVRARTPQAVAADGCTWKEPRMPLTPRATPPIRRRPSAPQTPCWRSARGRETSPSRCLSRQSGCAVRLLLH